MRTALRVFTFLAVASHNALAGTFTLTPVTVTTPNFGGTIAINGVVSMGSGESLIHPLVMSSSAVPFLSDLSAGFNGPGQNWDAAFLAWSGVGTYSGAIFDHIVTPGNLGYAGGMPLGLYGTNPLGPSGGAGITLHYIDVNGTTASFAANYAINVVPAPGTAGLMALGGLLATRRRRA